MDEAQALCESLHPQMSLAEFDQPGEETAVMHGWFMSAYPGQLYTTGSVRKFQLQHPLQKFYDPPP